MKIVFPEFNHQTIQEALFIHQTMLDSHIPLTGLSHPEPIKIEALSAPDLASACTMVNSGSADAIIAGIDYSSRDVILTCRDHFSMKKRPQLSNALKVQLSSTSDNSQKSSVYSTFSGLAVLRKNDRVLLLADMAACKHPTKSQLIEIILQTHSSAKALLTDEPRIALLSFSTLGSGGRDEFITLSQEIIPLLREQGLLIDGEMQLDTAIHPQIGQKKAPDSPVAGRANVLIAPDLNSGNLLYKSLEQFGGFTVAGPILQGFSVPVSDLSRGSTAADIILTMEVLARLADSR